MPGHPLHFNRAPVTDVDALVRKYESKEFNSPFRSTLPLLAMLKHAGSTLPTILDSLGVDPDAAFFSEYQVEVRQRRSKPSHTDLMMVGKDRCWAIEAKWTEPRYPTVGDWIAECEQAGEPRNVERRRANRQAVACGWLGMIRNCGVAAPDLGACGHVVYQMLHRAASACATRPSPCLVYLVFAESAAHFQEKEFYRRDLKTFYALLGNPECFPFYLVHVPLQETASFQAIKLLPKGDPETGEQVTWSLQEQTLFEFGQPSLWQIR